MKRISLQIGVVAFFALAIVGLLSDLSPSTAGLRAAAGAACLYVVTRIAARIVIRLLADAAIADFKRNRQSGKHS